MFIVTFPPPPKVLSRVIEYFGSAKGDFSLKAKGTHSFIREPFSIPPTPQILFCLPDGAFLMQVTKITAYQKLESGQVGHDPQLWI